jgi:glycosyltransferase involved in cell wall biosynthesis
VYVDGFVLPMALNINSGVGSTHQAQMSIGSLEGSRFLLVLGQYAKLGGAERQAIILADQLKNNVGVHVDFLAWGGEGRVSEELASHGIKAWVFPLEWNTSPPKRLIRLWQLARFIKRNIQPDYLLPYIGFNCKIIGLVWRRTGARYTWWNQRDEGREVYGSRLERHVINSVPDVVSNSLEGRDFLVGKFNLSPDRIRVINNGVEIPRTMSRQPWREKLKLGDDGVLITMVANFSRYKDHETAIRAFAMLCRDMPVTCLHLLLVGHSGETTQELKALAFDLGLGSKLHFAGDVSNVSACYAASDMALHSSAFEGCPNAVLEAMAHGLPVCGTDISGIRHALGVEAGSDLLAPAGDAEALSNVMRKLIENPELRLELGRRNRQRIENDFSPQLLAKHVLSLISNHLHQ